MFRWLKLSAALLTALVLVPGDVLAQVPKSDSKTWYEDDSKFGFKVKVPTDWDFVPPQPGETSLIGKYDPPHNKYITIGRDEVLWLHAYLVVFDRRPKPEDEEEILEDDEGTTITITWDREYRDIADWVGDKLNGVNWRQIEEDKLKVRGLEATEHVFEATGRSKDRPPIRAYAAVYRVSPEIDIALVFNGPGDKKKWKSYQKAFEKMAKSFKQVEVTATEITPESLPANASPRDKKRAKLIDEMRRVPGWELYETPNYLIISNNDDEDFLEELMERVEKIREIFEDDYPPEKARRAAKEPNSMRVDDDGSGDGGGDGGDGDDEAEEDEGLRSVSVQADPFEQSRASVIRVCKDQAQYHSYGGPGGSAGYWSSRDEELVIFDDKAGGGRADTWAVLNHEAFHQYIFYFYGELAPHSWYNEGTGDFYAGYYLPAQEVQAQALHLARGHRQGDDPDGQVRPPQGDRALQPGPVLRLQRVRHQRRTPLRPGLVVHLLHADGPQEVAQVERGLGPHPADLPRHPGRDRRPGSRGRRGLRGRRLGRARGSLERLHWLIAAGEEHLS